MAKLPDPAIQPSDIARFWAKVEKAGPDECWIWTSHRAPNGYGQMWMGEDYRAYGAHRLSLLISGRPSYGQIALHSCDNPSCVNPHHLSWGTYGMNASERYERDRCPDRKGERHPMAKLKADDVREIRSSSEGRSILAARFGTSPDNITQIKSGRRWKHISDDATTQAKDIAA